MSKHKKKKRNKKKVSRYYPTRHHVLPSSRGGTGCQDNIAIIPHVHHQNYHNLFENKTPEEIIEYLVRYFWKGNWSFVKTALKREEEK